MTRNDDELLIECSTMIVSYSGGYLLQTLSNSIIFVTLNDGRDLELLD